MNYNNSIHPCRPKCVSYNYVVKNPKSFLNHDMLRRCTETTRNYIGYSVTTSTISSNVKVIEKKTGIIREGYIGKDGLVYMNDNSIAPSVPQALVGTPEFSQMQNTQVFAAIVLK